MNALELNDPLRRDKKATSAVQALSAKVDRSVAVEVANKGSLVVASTTAITKYDQAAICEAVMQEQDIPLEQERCLILNARDAAGFGGDLANRQTMNDKPLSAYERSALPSVAGFDTLRASFQPRLTAAAPAVGATVDGAQSYVPLSTDANGNNVDNRTMDLTVNATGGIKAGDAFTIAAVFAVGHINKESTGELKTFRVVDVPDATTLTITPPIVPIGGATQAEKDYANCDAAAADAAAISFLNIADANVNSFFCKNAVEIIHGKLAVGELGNNISVMTETTDSGIEILFAKQGEIDDLTARYRLTMWAKGHLLNPEMAGILIGSQV